MNHRAYTTPRYYTPQSDSETSSTQSVRVSRLIEKIKAQQQRGGTGGYLSNSATRPFSYSNNDLIYSRVAREHDQQKRTVREVVPERNSVPFHKTTVLLNNDDTDGSNEQTWGYTGNYNRSRTYEPVKARYFGEETDYEYDRELSNQVRGSNNFGTTRSAGYNTLQRNQSFKETNLHNQRNNSASVPKIILHEEAVAEIPNGKGVNGGTRSPSFLEDQVVEQDSKSSRFLGGLLTLKRNKNKTGTVRSTTRSPLPPPSNTGTAQRRTTSYLNVPGRAPAHDNEHDSSSSPKYYVPYYRSTPTLYESRYDRMSSTGGSVLSNGSYINKHVSRSMSMKAPWEPRHRANEIDYYQDTYNSGTLKQEGKKRATLTRSKSMPGKKLSTIIGSWVTKNKPRQSPEKQEETKLIEDNKKKNSGSNWGRFTLLRFGKKDKKKGPTPPTDSDRGMSPERPARVKQRYRESVSPVRRYDDRGGGGGGGTLRKSREYTPRGQTSGGSGNSRGFY